MCDAGWREGINLSKWQSEIIVVGVVVGVEIATAYLYCHVPCHVRDEVDGGKFGGSWNLKALNETNFS